MVLNPSISITGLACLSGLGQSLPEHARRMEAGETGLRPLSQLDEQLPEAPNLQGSWIEPRKLTLSRKWSPCSQLAVHVAKEAVQEAGISAAELKQCAVIAGSSRGNAWLKNWPNRRPVKLMAASNSMHGEIASAVSIELGCQGPWQVLASGCAASLDAIGTAWMMLRTGVIQKAIVIGVELPLIPDVVQNYLDTGVLSSNGINDPYHPETSGFFPGEAATAIVLEAHKEPIPGLPTIEHFACNSDAHSPIGMPTNGAGLRDCIKQIMRSMPANANIRGICPHASGTLLHSQAEQQALLDALNPTEPISLHLLKPFTGHTVGASGALDTALLAHYMKQGLLPPNLPQLSQAAAPFTLPSQPSPISNGDYVLKISVGMGGHNSIVSLRAPR